MKEVKGFQNEYRFLSNFYPCRVEFEDFIYQSSEAAYQASKFPSKEVKADFTRFDARVARTQGKKLVGIRDDWEEDKLNVMYRILRAKFTQSPDLKEKLLSSGDSYLEETNYWHDTFWGVYNGKGMNHLGRLLMIVRDELKEGII